MFEVGIFLAGAIEGVINTWQQVGLFSYLLPFLLIFALVFGILTKVDLFKNNKVVNAIIALAVGLISIQFPAVSRFFSVIFPNLGIALSVILVILIIAGLFFGDIEKKKWLNYILLAIAAIIIVIVLAQSANTLGLPAAQWVSENWPMVIAIVIIIALIVAVVVGASKGNSSPS